MKCHNHSGKKAIGFCYNCGHYYCSDCLTQGIDNYYCKNMECQDSLRRELSKNKAEQLKVPDDVKPAFAEMSGNDLAAFQGNKWICVKSYDKHNEPTVFCKTLTRKEMQIIRDNPALLNSPGELYELLTDDLKLFLMTKQPH